MPFGRSPRLARTLLVLALLVVAAAAAPSVAFAERVTATLTFADGNGTKAPIRRATVEIWRYYGSIIGTWHNDYTVTTDENGHFDVTVPTVGPRSVYGLRVYAINDAAVVRFQDRPTDAFYQQPGPAPGTQLTAYDPSDVLDFTWNFTDPWTVNHFNIADALIDGHDYAAARRALGETDVLRPVNVFVQTANTYYDPVVDSLRINPYYAMDDFTILHEYGHYLEEQLSSFQALASWHDGCNVQLGQYGAHAESPGMAWMEGFADYFAQAVARVYGSKISGAALGTMSLRQIENPSCPGSTLPGTWLENFVAGALWDLIDPPNSAEPADRLCGQGIADTIFSIFDRELQRTPPDLQAFVNAWVGRGLDVPPLVSTFGTHGVTVTTPTPRRYYSSSAGADLAVWRPSEAGAWYVLGQYGPHWGIPGDVPVPADYDGDGATDAAVWRPSTGEWFVLLSASGGVSQVTQWGAPTDVPLPGDYDADGEDDFAVYRPSQNAVLVQNDSCGPPSTIALNLSGETPVVGDVDGDGADDPGMYNAGTGNIAMITHALDPGYKPLYWATLATGARPVLADYDGDGKVDLATYTPTVKTWRDLWPRAGGVWTIVKSSANALDTQTWGGAFGDVPVPADYDGDGAADLAVWNPSNGIWTIRQANGAARTVQWGQSGDVPVPR
jgi:hypothetical protein